MTSMRGTTIICVRRDGQVAMAGDGQVTLGSQVIKGTARKVRRVPNRENKDVIVGFAGGTADAITLLERFEKQLEENHGVLVRAAAALMKDWRGDKYLRKLEAMMIVADRGDTLLLSGSGDMLAPDGGVIAIGSGSGYAEAAGMALLENSDLSAEDIARKSIEIAARICIYTNESIILEVIK